jgi:TonB family protein
VQDFSHREATIARARPIRRVIARFDERVRVIAALLAWTFGLQSRAQESSPPAPAVTPPEVVKRVDAIYPPEAIGSGQDGTVVLLVTVANDGAVTDAAVAETRGASLDQAAIAAVKQWQFRPARRDGEAISSRIRIPFTFALPTVDEVAQPAPPPTPIEQVPVVTPSPPSAQTAAESETGEAPIDVTVLGKARPTSRGASDFQIEVGALAAVPRQNATEYLKLVPGILLTNEGGEAHAEQVFLRGFDAREGQDIEFTVGGVPINESGNVHGNGYADTHFIIPELVSFLRVEEGTFDPRQGNYAVAGSAEYELGWATRGITTKFTLGSFDTKRLLFVWGQGQSSTETFAGVELYETKGWGEARAGNRATVMAQVAGDLGPRHHYRLLAAGQIASFHSAGVLREDDYRAGRVGFYSSDDPRQGEDLSRISLSGELRSRLENLTLVNQVYLTQRPIRFRENFTGFLLDRQTRLQNLHPQRGDLLDASSTEWTLGARGSARVSGEFLQQPQAFEVGYFLRGDLVSSQQSRVGAGTNHPYKIDSDLDSRLGDIGLYFDLNLRPAWFLALRGGMRGEIFTFDVKDNCAVQSVQNPSTTNPPGDLSCLSQEEGGGRIVYREPFQRSSSVGLAYLPRGSILLGPFWGLTGSASYGQGIRSIDPIYVGSDLRTPFATAKEVELGASFDQRVGSAQLGLRSVWFRTTVDKELIFSETAGRNVINSQLGGTTRVGSASAARVRGGFYDLAANFTYVRAIFDDTHLLIPYIPDRVFRFDGALFGDLFASRVRPLGHGFRGIAAAGVTYVGARPLPLGERSNTIFTVDLSATLGWWLLDIGVSATNLFNRRYRLGEYNYVSDFHSDPNLPTLVPTRHFSAGAPRALFLSISVNLGGEK